MSRRLFAVALVAAGACLPSKDEYSGGGAPVSDAGPDGAAAVAEPDSGADAMVDASADADADAAPAMFASCKDVLAATAGASDGYYTTRNGELYCDMSTAGGGWTLVARSAGSDNKNIPFGWINAHGAARNEDEAFSLGVLDLALPFVEVLVGSYSTGKTWENVYRLGVTREALRAAPAAPIVVQRSNVTGSCTTAGDAAMLKRVGYTDLTNHFHLRDIDDPSDGANAAYGLFSATFVVNYDDCPLGGMLNGKPGMIFVR